MSKTAMIRARVEPDLKRQAETVFAECGLSVSQAIKLFYRQVHLRRGLPFEIKAAPQAKPSKVAAASTGRLQAKVKSMTPDERLEAFYHHSRLIGEMNVSGQH